MENREEDGKPIKNIRRWKAKLFDSSSSRGKIVVNIFITVSIELKKIEPWEAKTTIKINKKM